MRCQLFHLTVFWPQEYISAGFVVGTLLYVPSVRSIIFGLEAAVFNAIAASGMQYIMGPLGLPTSWSHGFTLFVFACLRFTGSSLVPVAVANMTCPEDHIYQARLLKKIVVDMEESLFTQIGAAASTKLRRSVVESDAESDAETAWADAEETEGEWDKQDGLGAFSLGQQILDALFLVMSWGAFSHSDLEPNSHLSDEWKEDEWKEEVAPAWLIERLLGVYRQLDTAVETIDKLKVDVVRAHAVFVSSSRTPLFEALLN